jgi:DNA-binding CsgD family transcriptional regulator
MQDDPFIHLSANSPYSSGLARRLDNVLVPSSFDIPYASGKQQDIYGLIVETAQSFVTSSGSVLSIHDAETHTVRVVASYKLSSQMEGLVVNSLARRTIGRKAEAIECARDGQLPSIMHGLLVEDGGKSWIISLVSNDEKRGFDKADIQALIKLRGIFRATLQQHIRSIALYPACWAIVDRHSSGIALLHDDGHVAVVNKSALMLLNGGKRGLAVINGRLACPDPHNAVRLRHALEEVRFAKSGQGCAFMVEGARGCGLLQINLVRLDDEESLLKDVTIAAFITDPEFFSGPSIEQLQTLYHLTRVEAEVVQLICQGFSPSKAAQKLKISVHTVRSYLKSIFSKIGVNRQADVVRIVAHAPRLLGNMTN